MELTLHVGLKKTATTALQQVLHSLKGQLMAEGLLFPCTPVEHQRLARRVRVFPLKPSRPTSEALTPILDEISAVAPRQVLLSSEHLIAMPGQAVEELHRLLAESLPQARLNVLAYVREPVAFATSMCQQNIKNGLLRLADFHADPWPYRIAEWIGTYIRVFGREAVRVRHFHPDHLVGGDILTDVLSAVGLEGVIPAVKVPRLNPSLSLEGVMVADALAGLRPAGQRKRQGRSGYRRPLSKIEGSRFVLPALVQERVVAGSVADMAWLRAEFGLDIRPQMVPDCPVPALTEAMALARALKIVEAVEG